MKTTDIKIPILTVLLAIVLLAVTSCTSEADIGHYYSYKEIAVNQAIGEVFDFAHDNSELILVGVTGDRWGYESQELKVITIDLDGKVKNDITLDVDNPLLANTDSRSAMGADL
ncbi:MAG: hypothetical protein LBC96_00600 [Lachnospiraceae bacterium]|nr:hypothetical protein [Lachnospiraceae bacterium]